LVFTQSRFKATGLLPKLPDLNLRESDEVKDSWRMKFTRAFFPLALLLVVFSHPLWADTSDTSLTDTSFVQAASANTSDAAYSSSGSILAGLESGFIGGIVPLVALLLLSLAVWLAVPVQRIEREALEQLPAEVPPLRTISPPIAKF